MIFYFDLDGVLADFDRLLEQIMNTQKLSKDEALEQIFNSPSFFTNLPVIEHPKNILLKLKQQGYDVQILTSCGEATNPYFEQIVEAKRNWVNDNISTGIPFNYVTTSSEKSIYANEYTLLIDDRVKSVSPFSKAGGYAIHYVHGQTDLWKELKPFL